MISPSLDISRTVHGLPDCGAPKHSEISKEKVGCGIKLNPMQIESRKRLPRTTPDFHVSSLKMVTIYTVVVL